MIFTRYGSECSIVSKHGSVKAKSGRRGEVEPLTLTLVKVHHKTDSDAERAYFAVAETLRADSGWDEISAAIERATYAELSPNDRAAAMRYLSLTPYKAPRSRSRVVAE